MLEDIIAKLAGNEGNAGFDFSLRPNHNIDNPFTKRNIISDLETSIEKTDKSVLADIILEEAQNNINFSCKIFSQIANITAEEEGLLYKARLINILNEFDNRYSLDSESYADLINFANTLLNTIDRHINAGKLENAFIVSLLLYETDKEMVIRNMPAHYVREFEETIITRNIALLHTIAITIQMQGNSELNRFFIKGLLEYLAGFTYIQNDKLCFDMLYFASLVTDDETAQIVLQAAEEIRNMYKSLPINTYVKSGIICNKDGVEKLVEYVCEHTNMYHFAGNIADTCMIMGNINAAEKILSFFVDDKKTSKQCKLAFYRQLQGIYYELDNKEKVAYAAKQRFLLGDKNAYFEAVDAYTAIGLYEREKNELHEQACKDVPIYAYCWLLANNKEYDLLIDRVSKAGSSKDISEVVKFMDGKGITLYDNDVNKKLLTILAEKTKKYKKLAERVKNLLKLMSV